MSLWDFLTNIGNNISNKGSQLFQNMTNSNQSGGAAPLVAGLQLDMNGDIQQVNPPSENFDVGNKLGDRIKHGVKNFNLSDALLGKSAAPTDYTQNTTDENGMLNAGISENPRRGGLINDIAAGARENFNNSFRGENWLDNQTSDGRQKGFAYRLGEGLGSLGRFMESPAGRSLLTAGLVGATGGSGLEALAYGGQAGLINQNARSANTLYRNQLKNNYGMTDEELNNIRGYVNRNDFNTLASNIYKNNALNVRQAIAGAQDNTKRANMIMQGLNNGTISPQEAQLHMANYGITFDDLKESNATRNADINEELLPYKQFALKTAPQVALGQLGLAQNRFNYQQQQDAFDNAVKLEQLKNKGVTAAQRDAQGTLGQINLIRKLISDNPNASGLVKGLIPGDILNRWDGKKENIETRTAIDALRTKVRHDLTGAQFSPKEAKEYEKFLPTTRDTKEIIEAKLNALEMRYQADFGVSLLNGNTPGTQQIGKYKVKVK
jgi:hypothetical protein